MFGIDDINGIPLARPFSLIALVSTAFDFGDRRRQNGDAAAGASSTDIDRSTTRTLQLTSTYFADRIRGGKFLQLPSPAFVGNISLFVPS